MHPRCIALLLISSCILFVGCGDTHDKIASDSISQLRSLVNVLEGIETVEDAKNAKAKLESIAKNMKSVKTRMDKIGSPSSDEDKKLKEKFEKEFVSAMTKIRESMAKMTPEIQKELDSAMKEMPKG